jgi:hypothetical protein
MNQKPTIGRIVLATIKDARGTLITRPAIIVRTWPGPTAGEVSPAVQAQVFTDGNGNPDCNDGLPAVVWKTSLRFDENGESEDTWRWRVLEFPLASVLRSSPGVDWVDLSKSALDLCYAIEKLPASVETTDLSIQASALATKIAKHSFPQS